MNEIRSAFCETAGVAAQLLGTQQVADRWSQQSALSEFSVAGLCGHLLRSSKTVEIYLDQPEPEGDVVSGAGYFQALSPSNNVNSRANQAIRARGEEMAAPGPIAVAKDAVDTLGRLQRRLEKEPASRKVSVAGDLVLVIDEYLRTRLIELVVHIDDLALSVGLTSYDDVPSSAYGYAIDTLVGTARGKCGDLAVLRALARRERDESGALRVL